MKPERSRQTTFVGARVSNFEIAAASLSAAAGNHQKAYRRNKEEEMFLGIGILLVLLWLGGFVMFHTAGFLIHILLVLALVSFVFHFLRGRTSTV
jgi:hypothetical protein